MGQAERHGVQRRLGRAIGHHPGQRHQRTRGGDVDDAAALAFRHAVRHLRREAEGALEIEVHDGIEQLLGDLVAGRSWPHAGVVDQDVDAAKGGIGLFHQPVALRPFADMGADSDGAAAKGTAFLGHRFAIFQIAAGDDDIGAALGQSLDHLIAQTPAAAGDQRHLAGEIKQGIKGGRGCGGGHGGILLLLFPARTGARLGSVNTRRAGARRGACWDSRCHFDTGVSIYPRGNMRDRRMVGLERSI